MSECVYTHYILSNIKETKRGGEGKKQKMCARSADRRNGPGIRHALAASVTLGAVFALYKCGAGYVLVAQGPIH